MDKSEAKALGLKKYSGGPECKRGHNGDRWTSTGMCCECMRIAQRKKYWDNPDAARKSAKAKYNPEYYKAYYAENKERITARNRGWLEENKERKRELDREYRSSEREKIREANKKWASENPDKRMASWRNRDARLRNADGTHNADDVALILEEQNFTCPYCLSDLSEGYHVDHYVPLAKGGSNWPDNLQCLCPTCNTRKGAKEPDVWHAEIWPYMRP